MPFFAREYGVFLLLAAPAALAFVPGSAIRTYLYINQDTGREVELELELPLKQPQLINRELAQISPG